MSVSLFLRRFCLYVCVRGYFEVVTDRSEINNVRRVWPKEGEITLFGKISIIFSVYEKKEEKSDIFKGAICSVFFMTFAFWLRLTHKK